MHGVWVESLDLKEPMDKSFELWDKMIIELGHTFEVPEPHSRL